MYVWRKPNIWLTVGVYLMVRNYEELSGADGREVYFRAERFPARSFFGENLPLVRLHDKEVDLVDLSMSGLALELPASEMNGFVQDAEVPLELAFQGDTLFRGTARVARIEATNRGTKLGVSLPTSYLDLPAIKTKILQASAVSDEKLCIKAVRSHVSEVYRTFIADLLYVLRSYQVEITEFVDQTSPEPEEVEAFLQACEEQAVPQWRRFCEQGNDLVTKMASPEEVRWSKKYTEALVTPETLVSPLQQRAYEKPLGYPGDYRVMDYAYDWKREGSDPYAQLVHRLALEPMRCVRTRLEKQQDIIRQEVERSNGSRPVKITNIACGTAQEILNLLNQNAFTVPVDMTLVDQEKNTLAFAYERTYPHVQRLKGQVTLNYWNTSFKQLMRPDSLFDQLGGQDLIYSLGMFDYLKEKRAKTLVRDLYKHVAPGGLLVIANLKEGGISKWTSEFTSDWSMIYRTEGEMAALAEGLEAAEVSLQHDALEEVVFLCVRRTA